jgi:hypothetical protein
MDIRRNIHRLVLSVFDREPLPGEQAAHLDGNKDNNRLDNLKWCTKLENEAHKIIHGTHLSGAKVNGAKLTAEQVVAIRERAHAGETLRSIALSVGMSGGAIWHIVTGNNWPDVGGPLRPRRAKCSTQTNASR